MSTSLRALLDRQVEYLERGDLDALVDQYHEDAVVVRFDRTFTGREAVRALFAEYLAMEPRVLELVRFAGAVDTLSYQARMVVGGQEVLAFGTWVIRDDAIWRQTAGSIASAG